MDVLVWNPLAVQNIYSSYYVSFLRSSSAAKSRYQDDSKELNAFASSFAPSVPKGFSDKSSSPDQSSMQPVLFRSA